MNIRFPRQSAGGGSKPPLHVGLTFLLLPILFLGDLSPTLAAAEAQVGESLSTSSSSEGPTTTRYVTIGGVLSAHEYERRFQETVERINHEPDALPPGIRLNSSSILMLDNPVRTADFICKTLIPRNVYVVIASHPPHSDLSPLAVSFTCGFYSIPVIGIAARNSAFSDKNVHTSFMRTVAPYSDQAVVWVEIVSHFQWKKVIFMHSSDEEGRAMLGRFQSQAEDQGIQIEKNIQYIAGQVGLDEDVLSEIATSQARVLLLYASQEDAEHIYRNATQLNLTGPGYVWIVTEQALRPSNVPIGTVGLRQVDSDKEAAHINDSVRIIAKALKEMLKTEELGEAPSECNTLPKSFESGPTLFSFMKKQVLENGATGKLAFNDAGDRLNPAYQIVNIQPRNHTKEQVIVGTYGGAKIAEEKLQIRDTTIIWPGNQTSKPKGIKISTHLKVVTMQELPFIYVDPVPPGGKCNIEVNRIPCPRPNTTGGTSQESCCSGYAIDLLVRLARTVNFTYDLHLAEENSYGSYERVNGSKKQWNGMIGELVNGQSDLIVAPLTMNPERAEHIDFSKPFKYQGLAILVKKTTKDSSLASFLQPFQDTLWILVGLSVHVVALVLYLLDRFSPFGRFKLAKSDDTEEDALNLSSAMWFAWGVLLNSGIGEGTPRSFSARVLGMVWAGFAMIIVASYTANLAAFLVLDRPEASISGIDDARKFARPSDEYSMLRNPQENFKYATVKNSAVAMYFKRQVELSTMYRTMESRNYESAEQAIMDVKEGRKLQAFIWDSSRLEYEAANDCDLVTAGELFGRSGYGIGLPKGSPWTQDISLAILSFHESGYMEQLDGKWILVKDTKCPEKDTSPATLGLTNMAGVFMMVAGGIVAGVFLIFVEIAYKRHRGLKEKELELAKTAADRWRGNIEKRRTLRRTLLQQQQERQKTNGTTSSPAHPALAAFNKTTAASAAAAAGGGGVGSVGGGGCGTSGGGGTSSGYQRVPVTVPAHEAAGIGPV